MKHKFVPLYQATPCGAVAICEYCGALNNAGVTRCTDGLSSDENFTAVFDVITSELQELKSVQTEVFKELKSVQFEVAKFHAEIKAHDVVESRRTTPSEACLTKQEDSHFKPILRALRMDIKNPKEFIKGVNSRDSAVGKCSSFRFDWIHNDVKVPEAASYNPTKEYLECLFPGHPIHVIGNGQGLPDGLLYSTMIYSLKEAAMSTYALRMAGFTVPRLTFILHGRSDLVKLRKNETVMIPEMVEFAVEIKPKYDFEDKNFSDSAFREAALQVIGLNAGNDRCSPAVVLTNLVGRHYVLFIEKCGELNYTLEVESYTTLSHACQRASFIGLRICVTADFGRAPTPGSTPPRGGKKDADGPPADTSECADIELGIEAVVFEDDSC